jgi:hypothetical protein
LLERNEGGRNIMNEDINEKAIKTIIRECAGTFPSFGRGSQLDKWNPIAVALEGKPPVFAAGVEIEHVVKFVIGRYARIKKCA